MTYIVTGALVNFVRYIVTTKIISFFLEIYFFCSHYSVGSLSIDFSPHLNFNLLFDFSDVKYCTEVPSIILGPDRGYRYWLSYLEGGSTVIRNFKRDATSFSSD